MSTQFLQSISFLLYVSCRTTLRLTALKQFITKRSPWLKLHAASVGHPFDPLWLRPSADEVCFGSGVWTILQNLRAFGSGRGRFPKKRLVRDIWILSHTWREPHVCRHRQVAAETTIFFFLSVSCQKKTSLSEFLSSSDCLLMHANSLTKFSSDVNWAPFATRQLANEMTFSPH